MFEKIRVRARQIKSETFALHLAYRDPRTPLLAKFFAACVVAYAFSPIDLIPDFIPILGYVDDIIILPILFYISLRFIPKEVYSEHYKRIFREKPEKNKVF